MTRLKITFSALVLMFANVVQAATSTPQDVEHTKSGHDHSEAQLQVMHVHEADEAPHENEQAISDPQPEHDEQASGVRLTETQMRLAKVQISPLVKRTYQSQLYAPGEIKANGYSSYVLSPRVDSIVVKRHATLGQHIKAGAPLVTLFSAEVASAQTTYRLAKAQWQRVQKMGKGTVSEKRLLTAKAEYEVAQSQLVAFGLSAKAIAQSAVSPADKLGEYTLFAGTSGAVLSDNFAQGQRVDAGIELMLIADESLLWVEAQLSANQTIDIDRGTIAQVKVNQVTYPAKVIQEAHTIDQITRSRVVRLSVQNSQHQLHSGMFSDVYFEFSTEQPVLAVPEQALLRNPDGDWAVYVQDEDGELIATEIERGRRFGQFREIKGLAEGTKVVTQGAFFVVSEQAKGGFDPHNH
ncbi:efflux RND transporter periplasmic adaptor subunit [Pseudoalteromonas arctica]|uniref:Efflux RND transporter periplasmic adaptor subunit n=1 Tax=Pseudoalteromonas arctica TaxID=394751 RepID=A0A7Y0DQP9_9GAMM|nr:efflux RND transporter periplasmic adaptor subunit [Pseudoalteromonas arctica]NMM39897.1 efflux RND transporter periplasmic adaptor subunit [Pseudoalteromonas arctica]